MSGAHTVGNPSPHHTDTPFAAAMRILHQWWDPAEGLVFLPHYHHHDTRATIYYALGLLRNPLSPYRERAMRGICRVLSLQWDSPGTPWHGTFARFPEEFTVTTAKNLWRDFDPNEREFVGSGLLAILDMYHTQLPADVTTAICCGVARAAAGTIARNVSPTYTNIALMSAFLLERAGTLHNRPEWTEHGLALAAEIARLHALDRALAEFNSPTYYGVDLCALAQWRTFGATAVLRRTGTELESSLWNEIAQFYHPGLRNLCGPYLRAYGMDMTRYCAISGLWIAAALPQEPPPLPNLSEACEHAHDIAFAPLVEALDGFSHPAVHDTLGRSPARRYLRREFSGSGRRIVSARLAKNLMVGGLASEGSFGPERLPQAVPFTLHWRCPDGTVGWVRNAPGTALDARIETDGTAVLTWQPSKAIGNVRIGFAINATGISRAMVHSERWDLPGLTVWIQAPVSLESLIPCDDTLVVTYRADTGQEVTILLRAEKQKSGTGD